MAKTLNAVLNGNPDDPKTPRKWSNSRASVEYHYSGDYWTWKTPAGSGSSDVAQAVLDALRPYL